MTSHYLHDLKCKNAIQSRFIIMQYSVSAYSTELVKAKCFIGI